VLGCASLADARAQFAHARETGDIDLVLLDLGLPDGDGEALLGSLRNERGTPVIVISARHSDDPKIRLLDAGADDYLVKPSASASCWRECGWRCGTAARRCGSGHAL